MFYKNITTNMAYPIKLFDFQSEDGRIEGTKFLTDLDKTLTELFGLVQPDEKLKVFHKFNTEELPSFIKDVAEKGVISITKKLPGGSLNWKGTMGMYGRKTGTTVKKEKGLVYRMIINIGDTEVYYLDGEGLNGERFNEPTILPNGYALLCSPGMIDKVNIKVMSNPHRKNFDPKMKGLVSKIRPRKYMRLTLVLDLPLEGLEFPGTDDEDKIVDDKIDDTGEKTDDKIVDDTDDKIVDDTGEKTDDDDKIVDDDKIDDKIVDNETDDDTGEKTDDKIVDKRS